MFSRLRGSIWFKHLVFSPSTCLPGAEGNRVNKQSTDLSAWPDIYRLIGSQEPDCHSLFLKKTDTARECECLTFRALR